MSTHFHIGNPCTICGFPLTGTEAMQYLEKSHRASHYNMLSLGNHFTRYDMERAFLAGSDGKDFEEWYQEYIKTK